MSTILDIKKCQILTAGRMQRTNMCYHAKALVGRSNHYTDIAISGQPFVKRFALCYRTVVPSSMSCNVGVLWPNSWTYQNETWHGGRPWPRPHCVDRDPAPAKGAQPPIFGPCPLWPNGWMDQDATWYGGRLLCIGILVHLNSI